MAKLYFKYGAMGSSKSAQALITQFNYEELGMTVWLIKPSVDTRDGADIIRSRIGLERTAQIITPEQDIVEEYKRAGKCDVIISDEAQFFTPAQIDQLRTLVDEENIPVLCFGLRRKGHGQRPYRRPRPYRHRGQPDTARRQRQLCRHVPQVLEGKDQGAGGRDLIPGAKTLSPGPLPLSRSWRCGALQNLPIEENGFLKAFPLVPLAVDEVSIFTPHQSPVGASFPQGGSLFYALRPSVGEGLAPPSCFPR